MGPFRLGDRTVDLAASRVVQGTSVWELTPIETRLLAYLARRSSEVVPREELLTEVWGYKPGVRSRTIDNTTVRLRAKIEPDPAQPLYLHAVYGRGLRLDGVAPLQDASAPTSRFIGRQLLLARLAELIRGGKRLVTLWGPAGAGKSRLALEVLPRLGLEGIEVSCAEVQQPEDLDRAVAQGLGIAASSVGGRDLGRALSARGALLLLLDACEGAVPAVSERASRWLAEAPRLRVLVTSRIALGLPHEQQLALPPLEEDEAIALFLDRARQKDASFDAAPPLLQRVIRAVDQLPLALEMAAARVHLLGMERLAELLASPLQVLGGEGSASMARVLERSWQLLEASERRVLVDAARLEAPFDLDDLCAVAGLSTATALDVLASLAAQALLRVTREGSEHRYALYAVVRERARQEPATDETLWRHARWFARLGDPQTLERARFDATLRKKMREGTADLRSAMEAMLQRDPELAARCGLALLWRMAREGPSDSGLSLARRLEAVACQAPVRAALGLAEVQLCQMAGDHRSAAEAAERVQPLAQSPAERVLAACTAAISRRLMGDIEGTERALEGVRALAPTAGAAYATWLQTRALYSRDRALGYQMLVDAAHVAHRHGDKVTEGASFALLAHASEEEGDWDGCRRSFRRAMEAFGTDDITLRQRATTLFMLGRLERIYGDYDAAERALEEGHQLCQQLGHMDTADTCSLEIARIWFRRGWDEDALAALEPILTRTAVKPDKNACHALLLLGEIEEQRGQTSAARQALLTALEHAELARWEQLRDAALELLALVEDDVRRLEATIVSPAYPISMVRHQAIQSLLACRRGDVQVARSYHGQGLATLDTLDLRPESEAALWLRRAERELSIRSGQALPFGVA